MEIGEVRLRRGEEKELLAGNCWVYDNEVSWVDELCENGGIVDVTAHDGSFVGRGFFNGESKIIVRLITRQREEIDAQFLALRIRDAWIRRRKLGFDNACRVVFGDADGLPGLTVDKFGEYLSFQIVSLGMERFKSDIIEILAALFDPKGICERNDVAIREKEGLEQMSGCVYGQLPEKVRFRELDALMEADLLNGQKTGHFLDQQENRGRIRPYCRNAWVLDLCCHTGGFTVHAGIYGAKSVKSVDVSQSALDMLMGNAELNGVDHLVEPVCENVFDLVKRESDAGEVYDFIICDPPAFSKSRKTLDAAYRGYKELNYRCMKMVAPGGYLASFSCSQFMTAPLFLQMLREAAADAGRQVQLLEILMQSRDHAAAIYSETNWYLKGYIVRVL